MKASCPCASSWPSPERSCARDSPGAAAAGAARAARRTPGVSDHNWWNQDISAAPVDARSGQLIDWISGRTAAKHDRRSPAPSRLRTAAIRHSLRRRRRRSGARAGHVRIRRRERRRRPRAARLSDPGRGAHDGQLHRGRAAGRRVVRRSASARHRSRSLAALRDLRDDLERGGGPLGGGLRRGLRPRDATPAVPKAGRRPTPPASRSSRAGALRRGVRRGGDHARVPRHDARDQRLRLAGLAPRRQHRRRAADGRAAAAEGRQGHLRRSRPRCSASSGR